MVIKLQDYVNSYNATVREKGDNNPIPNSNFAMVDHIQDFSYRSLGFVFKPGVNINLSPIKIGATITTPNLSLGLLNNQSNRRSTEILPDISNGVTNNANSHMDYAGRYNTPWILDLGVEYQFNNTKINTMVGFFSKVNPYKMISKKDNSTDFNESFSDDPNYAIPYMASKQIVNFGVSIDHKLQNDLNFLFSFRTDFNHFDDSQLNRWKDYVPNMAFWDIYHMSAGLMTTTENFNISLGLNYGLGLSKNENQIVNMATISQANRLLGDINNNTSTNYHNIAIMFGLSYTVNAKVTEKR
ncbi:MAG: hypothetical protein P8L42_06795 [Flavicella sp.]|nr:hypothetical protein [Flavicella sp.]